MIVRTPWKFGKLGVDIRVPTYEYFFVEINMLFGSPCVFACAPFES